MKESASAALVGLSALGIVLLRIRDWVARTRVLSAGSATVTSIGLALGATVVAALGGYTAAGLDGMTAGAQASAAVFVAGCVWLGNRQLRSLRFRNESIVQEAAVLAASYERHEERHTVGPRLLGLWAIASVWLTVAVGILVYLVSRSVALTVMSVGLAAVALAVATRRFQKGSKGRD